MLRENNDDDDVVVTDAECCADEEEDPAEAPFYENFIANIVKNVEVTISNIHVRFEDNVTNPEKPFSVGVTLRELTVKASYVVYCVDLCVYL